VCAVLYKKRKNSSTTQVVINDNPDPFEYTNPMYAMQGSTQQDLPDGSAATPASASVNNRDRSMAYPDSSNFEPVSLLVNSNYQYPQGTTQAGHEYTVIGAEKQSVNANINIRQYTSNSSSTSSSAPFRGVSFSSNNYRRESSTDFGLSAEDTVIRASFSFLEPAYLDVRSSVAQPEYFDTNMTDEHYFFGKVVTQSKPSVYFDTNTAEPYLPVHRDVTEASSNSSDTQPLYGEEGSATAQPEVVSDEKSSYLDVTLGSATVQPERFVYENVELSM
jgi:hypothetical protein